MTTVYVAGAVVALTVLLLATAALFWVDRGPAPHVPADVQERIDATLPRSQAHDRWVANREELRQ